MICREQLTEVGRLLLGMDAGSWKLGLGRVNGFSRGLRNHTAGIDRTLKCGKCLQTSVAMLLCPSDEDI